MKSLDAKQCYIILGLEPGATLAQIKDNYRELVRQWHPDKLTHNPKLQEMAQEELKNINVAYDFLKTYTFGKDTVSPQSEQPDESENNQWEAKEAERRKHAAERQENERQERESRQRDREQERQRVQQQEEIAYRRGQLANAEKEARRKQEEAKRLRSQEETAAKLKQLVDFNEYGAYFVVAPHLTAPQIALITDKYRKIVETDRGIIEKIDIRERTLLHCEIKGYNEGIYVAMYFSSSLSTAVELRHALRQADHLRISIFRREDGNVA